MEIHPSRPGLLNACILSVFALLTTGSVAAQPATTSNRVVRCPIKVESPLLVKTELTDVSSLAFRIRDGRDLLSSHLRTRLSPGTQSLLSDLTPGNSPAELAAALVADLDQALRGPSLFSPERFAGISLTAEVQSLIAATPQGDDLVLLNRLLLEAAYPQEIARDLNRPVPRGLTIRSVRVTGRRGVGSIENELKSAMVGKIYTPALHREAVQKVDAALTDEVNQSFERQAGIEGGAKVNLKSGAAFLYITQCVEIDNASKSVDMIVKVLFLRTDLRSLAANILPLPRSIEPSFYDKMPAVLRAFNPILDFGYDRRFGSAPSLKLSTNLLRLKPLLRGEKILDSGTRLDFNFNGQKAFNNRFFQAETDLKLVKERPGLLIEQIDFAASFRAHDEPLSAMRQTDSGLHLSGQVKLRPRLGLLNTVYLQGNFDRTNHKVFDQNNRETLVEKDNTGAFRGIIDGRVWAGFTRLGIWFETSKASNSPVSFKRLAGVAGFEKEYGSGNQTIGLEGVVGGGRAWGAVPLYAQYFGGNNAGNFLYDSPDSPAMSRFPVGPLLRSYGRMQATVPSATANNFGANSYWHANLNLTIPVRSWSLRLIPDEETDLIDPDTNMPIRLNKMLENFAINSAKNTLTGTLMDDIIDELMKQNPNMSQDEAEAKAMEIAAPRAAKLVEREVAPAIRFISRHANLYAVKPLVMLDAAYLRGPTGEGRQRFAAGGGIQLVMIMARAEFGYLRSLPGIRGEAKGNFVFRLTLQNIF